MLLFQQTQWAPVEALRSPVARGEKEWALAQGKCTMDVALAKETFYHGEEIPVNITVSNSSSKAVTKVKVSQTHKKTNISIDNT